VVFKLAKELFKPLILNYYITYDIQATCARCKKLSQPGILPSHWQARIIVLRLEACELSHRAEWTQTADPYMWLLASLKYSPKGPCVPLQDDEDSNDWDFGMDWAGLQPLFADETDDLESTLQSIDEPLKPSLSSLSNTGVIVIVITNQDSTSSRCVNTSRPRLCSLQQKSEKQLNHLTAATINASKSRRHVHSHIYALGCNQ
jgi:hypothetical protein